jgi:hypothetical protein
MLITKLIWNFKTCIVNVETAFLYGELHKEIFMNFHEDMNSNSSDCLLLAKTNYGLVQSARELYQKLTSLQKLIGFKENKESQIE